MRNFIVYKSSAGSGKTYTLVKEYLKLILTDEDPLRFRHILAITFTNKAANEMKERVISSLHKLSALPHETEFDAAYLADVQKDTGLDEDLIRSRASTILELLLHRYTELAISTIDKFVHRVVRTFARDLRIPLDFDVELDSDNLLSKAIALLVTRVGTDPQLTNTLVEFAEQKAADDKNWHIELDLQTFAKTLLRDESEQYLSALREKTPEHFLKVRRDLDRELLEFEEGLKGIGVAALELVGQSGIDPGLFLGGKRGVVPYFRNLAELNLKKIHPSNTILEKVAQGQWAASKAKRHEKEAIAEVSPQLSRLFNEAQTFIENRFGRYQLLKLVHTHLFAISILNELDKVVEEIKADSNLLLIADFNQKISEIVRQEPAPFIYERLGDRYYNYLIDEFQDTSIMQWHNLLPLVDNALSLGHKNLVVGDGKQAIYRWRGGDVEQFAKLPALTSESEDDFVLQERAQVLAFNYDEKPLGRNYRSKPEIIEFNNELFRLLAGQLNEEHTSIYETLEQDYPDGAHGGYVTMEQVEPTDDETLDDAYLKSIIERIKEAQEDGYAPQDIAILVRKNMTGSLIANHLLTKGIKVVSSESLLLSASPEVNFIMELFRLARDPLDSLAQANAMRYLTTHQLPNLDFHDAVMKWSHWATDEEKTRYLEFADFLNDNGFDYRRYKLVQQPIYQSVEELVRVFNLAPKPDAFLQFFLDAVHNYTIKSGNNINDFLEWWEKQKNRLSVLVPEGTDAVRILTIHKSKGLQFPVVIVPFANWAVSNAKSDLWLNLSGEIEGLDVALVPTRNELGDTEYAPLLEEEKNKSFLDHLNMLYVAFTRPEDRLHVLTSSGTKSSVGNYLIETMPVMEGWKLAEQRLRMGERSAPDQLPSAGEKLHAIDHFPSSSWNEKLTISFQAPAVWHESGQSGAAGKALLCTALSRLENSDQVLELVTKLSEEGLIAEEEIDAFEEKVRLHVRIPELAPFFESPFLPGFRAELIDDHGRTYRPGRMFRNGDKASIVELKPGAPRDDHQHAIRDGGYLLKAMGYENINLYLCYFYNDSPEVVSVAL